MAVQLTNEMIKGAIETQNKLGVPASITLAQIIEESGGGNPGGLSLLAYKYNNLFGIKAGSSWSGDKVTLRNGAGDPNKYSTYRVYNSIQDSILDHAKLLKNDRYTQYTKTAKNYSEYAQAIHKAGYAENPSYASNLINIIEKYKLDQYDNPIVYSKNLVHLPEYSFKDWLESDHSITLANPEGTKGITGILSKITRILAYLFLIIVMILFFIKAFDLGGSKNG